MPARTFITALCALTMVGPCFARTIAPPTNFEQALAAALQQPFVTYARDHAMPCFADYVPTPEETRGQFHVEAAGDEYEPLQVGLYVPAGRAAATNVRIEVDIDLPHEIAYVFYDARISKWRPADHRMWYTRYPGGRTAMPQYVVPGATIDKIEPAASAAFWITFRTEADTPSGKHSGRITVTAEGTGAVERPLTVDVRSFALPRPNILFGMYYRPDRIPVYWQPKYQQLYAHDMAAHGMTSCQIVSFFPSFGTDAYQANGRVKPPGTANLFLDPWQTLLDPSEYADGLIDPGRMVEEQMKMLGAAGLLQLDMPVWTVQETPMCEQKQVIAATMRLFSNENDWPEIILQTRDEPPPWSTGPELLSQDMASAMLDFKRMKNCRTFTALSMAPAFAWGHLHDVWIVLAGEITPEMIREAHRQGSQVWTYSERLRYTNALINRYFAGLYTWGLGLAGNTPYAYHHHLISPPLGEAATHPVWLKDYRRPSHDSIHAYVLPGPDGPIPGIGWEGRREGVDDFRHLQLLETRIEAADASCPVAAAAAHWINELRRRIEESSVRGLFGTGRVYLWELDWVDPAPDLAPAAYRTIRATAAAYIERLAPAPGERNAPPTRADRKYPQIGWEGEPFDDADVSACVAAIGSGSVKDKRAAVSALTVKLAADANPADVNACLKAIVSVLDEPDVRIPALRAIRYLGPAAAGAAADVQRQLEADDPFIRCGAVVALAAMGHHGIDGLIAGLNDPFPHIATLSAECLGRMGPDAARALPALETAMAKSDPIIRNGLAGAIREIRDAGDE